MLVEAVQSHSFLPQGALIGISVAVSAVPFPGWSDKRPTITALTDGRPASDNSRRRWVRIAAMAIVGVTFAACVPESEDRQSVRTEPTEKAEPKTAMRSFELGDRSYTIPAEYISALRVGGEASFVRIRLPDFPAEIVVDEKSSG